VSKLLEYARQQQEEAKRKYDLAERAKGIKDMSMANSLVAIVSVHTSLCGLAMALMEDLDSRR